MKTGKLTIYTSDYKLFCATAEKMGMELSNPSQIGAEVNLTVKYRDLTQIGKLYYNVALERAHFHQAQPAKPTEAVKPRSGDEKESGGKRKQ